MSRRGGLAFARLYPRRRISVPLGRAPTGEEKMKNQDGRQQGAQNHAEGQHGSKTHKAFLEGLQGSEESEGTREAGERARDTDAYGQPHPGKHRLEEDREQHDAAEKNSEAPKIDEIGG